eukprot:Tbor_TRINITY_DN8840_c0_g1::TRINITY_DN8840_c0_g1_i1::g.17748::m.17748
MDIRKKVTNLKNRKLNELVKQEKCQPQNKKKRRNESEADLISNGGSDEELDDVIRSEKQLLLSKRIMNNEGLKKALDEITISGEEFEHEYGYNPSLLGSSKA